MVKKCFVFILLGLLILLLPSVALGEEKQEEEKIKFGLGGIGLQFTFPAIGLSAVMNIDETKSVQGVIGLFGDIDTYVVRGMYNFRKETRWRSYGYGMVGVLRCSYQQSYVYDWYSQKWNYREETETIMSYGGGFGIEYDWWKWDWAPEDSPPICMNLEIGLLGGGFKKADYDFSSITLGLGFHYRFF